MCLFSFVEVYTSLHGVTFQNSAISTVIAVMTMCVSVRNRSNVELWDKTTQETC